MIFRLSHAGVTSQFFKKIKAECFDKKAKYLFLLTCEACKPYKFFLLEALIYEISNYEMVI